MDVFNACYQLLVKPNSGFFVQTLMRDNIIEKFTVLAELHDEEKFRLGLYNFIQLNNIRMSNFLEDFNLSRYTFNVFLILNSALFEYFYGYFFIS